jgi:hypothetical protein
MRSAKDVGLKRLLQHFELLAQFQASLKCGLAGQQAVSSDPHVGTQERTKDRSQNQAETHRNLEFGAKHVPLPPEQFQLLLNSKGGILRWK